MFGLQKALAEGTQSSKVPDVATLEQQRQLLVMQMDQRRCELKALSPEEKASPDPLIKSLEAQLNALDKLISETMKTPAPVPSGVTKPSESKQAAEAGTKPEQDKKNMNGTQGPPPSPPQPVPNK